MKKSIYLILSLTVILVLNACSSVKVLDAWKADDTSGFNDNNVLVIARTQNKQARIAFEQEIADQLRSKGIKATESFSKFPKLNHDEEMSEERQEMIRTILDNEGFNGVVLTVVKDIQESIKTTSDGGYYAGGSYSSYYPSYYGGFYGYYRHPYSYSSYGNYVPTTTTTYTSKTYILETVIYDLDAEEGKQLISVVTTQIEDPKDVYKNAQEYVKKIVESLKDK